MEEKDLVVEMVKLLKVRLTDEEFTELALLADKYGEDLLFEIIDNRW